VKRGRGTVGETDASIIGALGELDGLGCVCGPLDEPAEIGEA
jgi:hypothetical protein